MSIDHSDPALLYTLPVQLTKKIYRDVPKILSPEDPKNSAKGKIIVITGGGTGIGAASAGVWVRAGAEGVVISGRRKELLDQTVARLETLNKGSTKIFAVVVDITKEADTDNLFHQVKKAFGRNADVVLANAGLLSPLVKPHLESNARWWSVWETNVLGLHNTSMSFIRSQPDPNKPIGSLIAVSSASLAFIIPGMGSYSTTKLATHRYIEYLDTEYPTLRVFSVMPGIVETDMMDSSFELQGKDKPEQTGAVALYLASPRADYLKGSITSVNWDVEEMEEHKDKIAEGLLKYKLFPVLPVFGGSGL